MNARIEMLLDRYVVQKIQKRFRREKDSPYALAEDFHEQGLSGLERSVKRLTYMLEQERPVVFKDERIGLIRTVPVNYEIFTEDEWKEIKKDHYIHEQGKVCNINPRYGLLLDRGFDAVRREIERQKGMYARMAKISVSAVDADIAPSSRPKCEKVREKARPTAVKKGKSSRAMLA